MQIAIVAITWAVLVAALAFGRRLERTVGTVLTAAYLLTVLVDDWTLPGMRPGVATVDLALLIYLLMLVWFRREPWLQVAGAAQMVVVVSHLATLMDAHIFERAAVTYRIAAGLGVCAALAWGTGAGAIARRSERDA